MPMTSVLIADGSFSVVLSHITTPKPPGLLFLTLLSEVSFHASLSPENPARVHTHRIAGGHRDHRNFDRPAAAGRAEGARGRRTRQVQQQLQATGPGLPQLHG